MEYDLVLIHAREDRIEVVEPLVTRLETAGLKVWYDHRDIRLRDDFRWPLKERIRASEFAAVILSPSFSKYWTDDELCAFFAPERDSNEKTLLLLVHALSPLEVAKQWPLLSGRASVVTDDGLDVVAAEILASIGRREAPWIPPNRLYGLARTPSVRFVGRKEELAVLGAMLREKTAVRVAASVEGLAGIGKTEFVLQVVYHLANIGAFPGGIFWFDAENPDLSPTWGTVIADGLGVPPGSVLERKDLALREVERRDQPTLIVLDNVGDWTHSRRPSPLPTGRHFRFLVTTRRKRLGGSSFYHFELGCLRPPFDRDLLLGAAERSIGECRGLDELLSFLGGHALGLELAGAYLATFPEETPSSYLTSLRDRRDSDVEDEVSELVAYKQTVRQAFQTLWDRIDTAARRAWSLAACFEPDLVTLELSEAVGLSIRDRRCLRRLHLVEPEPTGSWQMHRLTSEFGRLAGTEEERKVSRSALVLGSLRLIQKMDFAKEFRRNCSQLEAAAETLEEVLGAEDALCADFLDRLGQGMAVLGNFERSAEFRARALDLDLAYRGKDHPIIATRRSDLAMVFRDLGDLAGARDLLERALEADLQRLGEDHPTVAIHRSNLGLVLASLGDLVGARTLIENALETELKQLGADDPRIALDRANLATVLLALGELPQARVLLEQSIESDLPQLGEDHPKIATRRANLATILQALGELPEARELLELALESGVRQLGEEHPEVATRRSNLASVLKALGDLTGAKTLLKQALESGIEQLGEHHTDIACRRSNLASVLHLLGDLAGAKTLLEQALTTYLDRLGPDHLSVSKVRSNLAVVVTDLGDLAAAKGLLEQALESELKTLGESHPGVSIVRANLSQVLLALGDLTGATRQARMALQIAASQPKGSLAREQVIATVWSLYQSASEPLQLSPDEPPLDESLPDNVLRFEPKKSL